VIDCSPIATRWLPCTGATPELLGLATIEMELPDLLRGQRVDLRTPQELSRYFRDEVMRIARVQYAA
jgi:uncharacterized protein